jgi:hypothetical protein
MVRLNGWKEIATYLGKSVRTAQRWERIYNLPVHRLGHEGGEIVWADSDDLDVWLRSQSVNATPPASPAAVEVEASPDLTGEAAPPSPEPPTTYLLPWVRWGPLAALAILVIVVGAYSWPTDKRPRVVGWTVEGGLLQGIGSGGQQLWTARLPVRLQSEAYQSSWSGRSGTNLVQADLDGDGDSETLIAAVADQRSDDAAFVVLNRDGRERFPPVRPKGTVTFGDVSYAGPWTPYRVHVTTTASGEPRIHASFIHRHEFPTLLVTMDADGRELSRYWSNGYIDSVNTGIRDGRRVWLVGATNNESRGASLAVFRDVPSGAAPAVRADYVCTSCTGKVPDEFLVMPRRCIAQHPTVNGTALVDVAYTDDAGQVFAHAREGPLNNGNRPGSDVIYSFAPDLSRADVLVAWGLLLMHRDMHQRGVLDHEWTPAEEATLFPVLRWDGARFVEIPRGRVTY